MAEIRCWIVATAVWNGVIDGRDADHTLNAVRNHGTPRTRYAWTEGALQLTKPVFSTLLPTARSVLPYLRPSNK